MIYTTFKNFYTKQFTIEKTIIQSELEELLEDYKEYEEDYIKNWLQENNDCLDEDNIDEYCLNEIIGECIEHYSFNDYCSKLYLSDRVYRFMKGKLPEDSRNAIDYHTRVKGYEYLNEIVYHYLINNRSKDN